MICSAITGEADLLAFEGAWTALWSRVPSASPFQHPGWLLAWWRRFGSGRPVVAVLHGGGDLLGVLPCYVLAEAAGAKLLPIGVSLSDYHDALVAPGAPADAASRLLAAVLAAAPDVAVCDLVDLAPEAMLRRAAPPPGWTVSQRDGQPCPVLTMPPQGDLAAILPPGQVRKLRRIGYRLDRLGGAAVDFAGAGDLDDALDALIGWQRRRRAAAGEDGISAEGAAFLREAAEALLAAALLRLAVLRIAGRPAAAFLALAAPPDRLLLYMSGFDAAFATYSPGRVVLGALIEATRRDTLREVHFLRGDEAYKYDWGAVDRLGVARRFERLT